MESVIEVHSFDGWDCTYKLMNGQINTYYRKRTTTYTGLLTALLEQVSGRALSNMSLTVMMCHASRINFAVCSIQMITYEIIIIIM